MERIGIFGGTFDPIHIGHLITAQSLLEIRKLDKIIFIPCYLSPHKRQTQNSAPKHRLEILKLSIQYQKQFSYSEIELNRGEISFTIDTVRELKKQYDYIDLIIGFDNLIVFDSWKEPDELFNLTNVVVMKRIIDKEIEYKHKYYEMAAIIQSPYVELSSTYIRKRVSNDLPIDFMVTYAAKEYILKNNLYR
ncbi:MAG: nicotinate-nucleotide adenylyltransferase [Ignavibacteriaceae bacterium]|nr:nicotinate-nucleotide adenylyltransferase [Ignavibacteriaceae bacterium]